MDVLLFRVNKGIIQYSVVTVASQVTTLEDAQPSELWMNPSGHATIVVQRVEEFPRNLEYWKERMDTLLREGCCDEI